MSAKKNPTQRVVFTLTDSGDGNGKVTVDMTCEPSVKKRKTNSNALNMAMRLRVIIEQHWQYLSAPLPHNLGQTPSLDDIKSAFGPESSLIHSTTPAIQPVQTPLPFPLHGHGH